MKLRRGRKESRALATRLIPLLPRFVGLLFRLMRDSRVPVLSKLLVLGVAAYIVMPLDLIPDPFGVLGWTDDLFLLGLALRRLVMTAGEDVVGANWRGSPEALARLEGGLEGLGTMLPGPIHRFLERYAERW
ncbi:MAG: YkvA family protein [Gemmatimonadota bacterium]